MDNLAERPPYDTVNFKEWAKSDEDFKKIWQKCSGRLNFQDPETVRALSKAGLKADFDLRLELPDDQLCPPIPNRWNYVAWIHQLLDCTSPNYTERYDSNRQVIGLDIGTGASAIYTLLCLKARPNWIMCATDVDKRSFESGARNLALNNMLTRVKLLQTTQDNLLISMQALGVERLDFTICNPPFFSDKAEMESSLKGEDKKWKPSAVCTGDPIEMVYPDGDLGFVTKMVRESLVLKDRVTWYTSMLGKMSSAKSIIDLLRQNGVTNYAVGSIEVGNFTKRWVVAWSFSDLRPKNSIARMEGIADKYLPFPTEYIIHLRPENDISEVISTINSQLSSLDLQWHWDDLTRIGLGEASQDVWRRWYRREHERKKKELVAKGMTDEPREPRDTALAFRIRVIQIGTNKEIVIEWLRGRDQKLWESFCGTIHHNFKKSAGG